MARADLPAPRSAFQGRILSALMFCFYSSFSFRVWFRVKKAKTPRLTGNRGVLKLFLKSEVRSHDACMTADARPNGHISIGLRVLQRWCKRGFHINAEKEHHF